jgi:hypothetical protein
MKLCVGLEMKINTIFIKNERRTNPPKWGINTFKLAEENGVDQEERRRSNTLEDGTDMKRRTA